MTDSDSQKIGLFHSHYDNLPKKLNILRLSSFAASVREEKIVFQAKNDSSRVYGTDVLGIPIYYTLSTHISAINHQKIKLQFLNLLWCLIFLMTSLIYSLY